MDPKQAIKRGKRLIRRDLAIAGLIFGVGLGANYISDYKNQKINGELFEHKKTAYAIVQEELNRDKFSPEKAKEAFIYVENNFPLTRIATDIYFENNKTTPGITEEKLEILSKSLDLIANKEYTKHFLNNNRNAENSTFLCFILGGFSVGSTLGYRKRLQMYAQEVGVPYKNK